MIVVLTTIAIVAGGCLAAVNEVTKATIEANAKARLRSSILVALGVYTAEELFPKEGVSKLSADEIDQYFREHIEEVKTDSFLYWKAYSDRIGGELKAYVIRIAGSGFQGLVAMQVALSPDLKTILGAHVVEFEIGETPGLGFRMTEDWFWKQFSDMQTEPKIEYVKFRAPDQPKKPYQFDAITGATFTSTTVRDLLNQAIAKLKKALDSEQKSR
ncbi:MAG: FMN-binding protein [Candidatus Bipolaricaulota bacterium]|nr:FMN-binding protein [Candidatus Bipolaricaulota bacterium]MCS7274292.1 FMN-binding protein [Candidatus Bipolaricaulota bacterium]MDW8111457.1 FMN-binding protein [Candidatus Bipolaricaulota bacterium]MDW8329400.1 FMN-binding protein [Candidatus Bipolaricaulota bacterium]